MDAATLGPVGELLTEMIPRAAKVAKRRFPFVEAEDFESEMWAAVLAKPAHFKRIHVEEDNAEGIIWTELRRVATKLGSDDDRDRRARKAKAAGYSTADEAFYNRGMLSHIIPVLIEAEWQPGNAVERATRETDAAGVRIHHQSEENATENYLAILIDVDAAFRRLKPELQRVLTDWFAFGGDEDDSDAKWDRQRKASSMGLTYNAFELRKRRALDLLERELGGRNPWIRRRPADSAEKTA